jgi:hypothetical protein
VVSENHGNALGAFREPLPSNEANPSNCKRFRQYVFIANSDYRTRYPLVAGTTVCCAGRESSRSWQASIAEDLDVTLRQFSADTLLWQSDQGQIDDFQLTLQREAHSFSGKMG